MTQTLEQVIAFQECFGLYEYADILFESGREAAELEMFLFRDTLDQDRRHAEFDAEEKARDKVIYSELEDYLERRQRNIDLGTTLKKLHRADLEFMGHYTPVLYKHLDEFGITIAGEISRLQGMELDWHDWQTWEKRKQRKLEAEQLADNKQFAELIGTAIGAENWKIIKSVMAAGVFRGK